MFNVKNKNTRPVFLSMCALSLQSREFSEIDLFFKNQFSIDFVLFFKHIE